MQFSQSLGSTKHQKDRFEGIISQTVMESVTLMVLITVLWQASFTMSIIGQWILALHRKKIQYKLKFRVIYA